MGFKCEHCGNCCTGKGVVFMTEREIGKISVYLHLSPFTFREQFLSIFNNRPILKNKINGECIFHKNNRCSIHEAKPDQCKAWPFWSTLLKYPKNFQYAKGYCEGLKKMSLKELVKESQSKKIWS